MLIKTEGAQPQDARYVFTDRLGSVVKYTNAQGVVVQPQDFDGWGQRRNPTDPSQAGTAPVSPPGLRGFTGHEMVDGQDVIHMNARLYDPMLGRFLQADPLVQAPQNLQSWNAYTYVLNNPLTLIDPTGMFSWRKLLGVFGQILNIVSYFITALKPFAMAFNIVMGMANGGIKGGLLAAFGSQIPAFDHFATNLLVGTLYGGVSSMIMGGSFKQGIMGSLKSAAIGMVLGAMAQGVKSRQTGGKYRSGADTSVMDEAITTCEAGPEPKDTSWEFRQRNEAWADKITVTTGDDGVIVIKANLTVSGDYATEYASQVSDAFYGVESSYNGFKYRSEIKLAAVDSGGDWQVNMMTPREVKQYANRVAIEFGQHVGKVGGSNNFGSSVGRLAPDRRLWRGNFSVAHEFGHALGLSHAMNSSGSIMSYACNRAVLGKDLYLISSGYRR